jgi:hypothetical protein
MTLGRRRFSTTMWFFHLFTLPGIVATLALRIALNCDLVCL